LTSDARSSYLRPLRHDLRPLTRSGSIRWGAPIAAPLAVTLFLLLGLTTGASARGLHHGVTLTNPVDVFDANIRYTSAVFLPLATYTPASVEPLTTASWAREARALHHVAADGVSLLLVRVQLPGGAGSATFSLPTGTTDVGSLWAVDDQSLVDVSKAGGIVGGQSGPTTLTVSSVTVGSTPYAFALYRAPQDFDDGTTGALASRPVALTIAVGTRTLPVTLTVVRPLVVFVHGTLSDNDAWINFPLWQNSANELTGWQPPSASTLPFATDRISFNWIWNATGRVVDNAATILPQLVRAIRDWREATGTAGTRADVITHSFGGFIARQVVQTQPDPDPLTTNSAANFRAQANWGHGSIHKLITLAATHRGSAKANAAAYLNHNGSSPGFGRQAACLTGSYIDQGALADQMLLSPALLALGESLVPGHAVVGSGRALLDPSGYYKNADFASAFLDTSSGPYWTAIQDPNCGFDAFDNYAFNLDKNTPPFTGSGTTCSETPNYDLVVSAYSSAGLLPASATTTVTDLEQASGLALVGRLNHSGLISPTYGSAAIVDAVSNRLVFLLQQPTTSSFFSSFPAVASVAPNTVEQTLGQYDPTWLQTSVQSGNACPAPSYATGCTASYSAIQVIPSQLALEDAAPAPLFVYGLLNGQWVLAHYPTVETGSPNRNCAVTFTSSDTSVVGFFTNPVTGATVPTANGNGTATITVTVQGFTGSIPAVPVTVRGF
jgi:hypothetical protein